MEVCRDKVTKLHKVMPADARAGSVNSERWIKTTGEVDVAMRKYVCVNMEEFVVF